MRAGNVEDEDRFSKRTVSMTKEHQEDCKRLLRLMGVPVVEAPCEAESQCAALARAGKVYAAGSEDMDTLTFASPVLVCGCVGVHTSSLPPPLPLPPTSTALGTVALP